MSGTPLRVCRLSVQYAISRWKNWLRLGTLISPAISCTFSHGHCGEKFIRPLNSTGTGLASWSFLAAPDLLFPFCFGVEMPSASTFSNFGLQSESSGVWTSQKAVLRTYVEYWNVTFLLKGPFFSW